ncbi:hypothetical protein BSKO_08209 [Bryopsis sp. KO-2023]|nr:hypothetical protein BSKO_08209 [Bryopsis sp. KO-2023]
MAKHEVQLRQHISGDAEGVTTPQSARSNTSNQSRSRRNPGRELSSLLDEKSPEEQLLELREKYSVLEGDRRSAVEIAQFTIRQHRETVAHLKKEQKELKTELKRRNAASRDDGGKSNVEREICEMEKRVHQLRRTHDKLSQHRQRCEDKLGQIQDGIKDLERGSEKCTSSPHHKNIRVLENRLDKAMIKRNEAISIQKTYEQLVKRLREECSAFDTQLKSMDEVLKAKKSDVAHLTQISHDGQHAREQAKQELAKVKEELEKQRGERAKSLEAQHNQLKAVQEMSRALRGRHPAKAEPASPTHRGGDAACVSDHMEAFRQIQGMSHVDTPGDLADRFLAQDQAFEDLKSREKGARQTQVTQKKRLEAAKFQLESAKIDDPAEMGSKGLVDRAEGEMESAVEECNAGGAELKVSSQSLANIKAGLQHLVDMLEDLPSQAPPIPLSEHNLVEVAIQCGDRMERACQEASRRQNEVPPVITATQQNTLADIVVDGAVSSAQPDLT